MIFRSDSLKLNDIPVGAKFILNRSGLTYIKGEQAYWKGKPLTRFLVYPQHHYIDLGFAPTLSLQCEVTPTQ
jgi:hypothetical protein